MNALQLSRQVIADHTRWIAGHPGACLGDLKEHLAAALAQCEQLANSTALHVAEYGQLPEPLATEMSHFSDNHCSFWQRVEFLEELIEQIAELERAYGTKYPLEQLCRASSE